MPSHWPTRALNASHSLLLAKTKEKLYKMPKHLKSKDNHTKYACSRARCESVSVYVCSRFLPIAHHWNHDVYSIRLSDFFATWKSFILCPIPSQSNKCVRYWCVRATNSQRNNEQKKKNRKYLTMVWCVSVSYICKYTHTKCHCFVDHIWRWRFVRWG